ncbi:MAG: SHOCT domain-containing protein [Bacilli bacterium]
MKDSGLISDDEFEKLKQELLANIIERRIPGYESK